jgi:hypothetical protein
LAVATATQKVRSTRRSPAASGPANITFAVFEDNGGSHRWEILDARGASLAQSPAFANRDAAHIAASNVREAAATSEVMDGGGANGPS